MITTTRDGKTCEITDEDHREIFRMALVNGGDINKAIAEFHMKKFGEPFEAIPKP